MAAHFTKKYQERERKMTHNNHPNKITNKAVALLLFLCSYITSSSTTTIFVAGQKSEHAILKIFNDEAEGDSWLNKWDINDTNVCNPTSYPGVTCNDDNKITEIDLHDNKLSGKVTPWIYALQELTTLGLGDNDLTGGGWDTIADVAEVSELGYTLGTKLKSITLSSNKISSVDGIDALQDSLKELHLTYNKLFGPMPTELFKLSNLKVLSISENMITGTIDTRLGNLTNLNEFYCYGNKIVGQIPMEVGQLSKLQILTVSTYILYECRD